MAALGYDAAKILADAMKRAGSTDGPALRNAIAATKGFKGVTGIITIDKDRNAQKPAVVLQIKGTIWRPIEVNPQFAVLNVPAESTSSVTTLVHIANNMEEPLTLSHIT